MEVEKICKDDWAVEEEEVMLCAEAPEVDLTEEATCRPEVDKNSTPTI
jgi:hypothetical protein